MPLFIKFLISNLCPLILILIALLSLAPTAIAKSKHRIVVKRFVLHRHQWDHCQLTWAFRDPFLLFASEARFKQAKKVVGEAITKWEMAAKNQLLLLRLVDVSPVSRESPLNARRMADIDIFFAEFGHGDAEAFDGTGGLVAHSAYPPLGIVHFDASERWHIGQRNDDNGGANDGAEAAHRRHARRGRRVAQSLPPLPLDLRYVALHEIGHALGLRHSSYRHSVMNTYYRQNLTVSSNGQKTPAAPNGFKLSKDDEAAINELFAEKCQKRRRKRRANDVENSKKE